MSKKETEPVKWNGFNYKEVRDYLGDEVRVHPVVSPAFDLDRIVVEGFIVELGTVLEKIVSVETVKTIFADHKGKDLDNQEALLKEYAALGSKNFKKTHSEIKVKQVIPAIRVETNETVEKLSLAKKENIARRVDIQFSQLVKAYNRPAAKEEEEELSE